MLVIVKLGKTNLDYLAFKSVFILRNHLAIQHVSIRRSMTENVIKSISMKNATMMKLIVVQIFTKLVIASATQKMTSELATMMVEIAV